MIHRKNKSTSGNLLDKGYLRLAAGQIATSIAYLISVCPDPVNSRRTSILHAKVEGRCAANRAFDDALGTRCGRGNLRFFVRSCLMYGRLTSSVFSISTTFNIYYVGQHMSFPKTSMTHMDRPESSPMSCRHILIQGLDSVCP